MKAKSLVFTGGHHTAGLEVAKLLAAAGWQISWFGHRHSMWGDLSDSAEYTEVTSAGITFYDLKAGKFYHTFNPFKLLRIPLGFIQAFFWLLTIRPQGIISFGGYLSVPTVICGWLLGIPSITHEQTTVIGWANRTIIHLVKKVCLSFPNDADFFPSQKTIVIGLPLRPEIVQLKNTAHSSDSTILISCGKQGSHFINTVIFAALPKLLSKYRVIHQTGSSSLYNDYQTARSLKSSLSPDLAYRYEVYDYLMGPHQAQALGQASLVIGRSGAHFTYELGYLGKPAILIPLPNASHNEQWQNAQLLKKHNLAIVIRQSEFTPQRLIAEIDLAKNLSRTPLPLPSDAAQKLVTIIESIF